MNAHRLDALLAPHREALIAFRHDLHRHPELKFEEHRTAGKVEEALRAAGYGTRRMAGTGVVADIGDPAAEAVLLRGDMDALPLEEKSGAPWTSEAKGRMHACGHDGHTAMLLGTALALADARDRLKGRVRLLFQPGEEGGAGALRMREEGCLDGVAQVYGIHNWPRIPLGAVGVRPGPMMAASALFEMTVVGTGGHGSQPQDARDPVLAAAHVITAVQSLVSRETHPLRPAVVSVCTVHGGTAVNIIPDRVSLSGTLRTFDDAQADHLGERLREIATSVAGAWGCTIEYRYERYYPVTSNHPAEAALVAEVAEELMGPGCVHNAELPTMGAEDFSFLLQQRPGAYFFVGGGAEGRSNATCHSPLYDFNDDLLLVGPRMYLRIVEKVTGSKLAE